MWSDYGIVISEIADFYSRPELVTDGQSGALITWTADTTATDNKYLYFSRVDSSGNVIWINNPISISSRWSTTKIVSNSNYGAIFCYAKDSDGNNPVYYLQSVDREGFLLWGNYGIIYSTKLEKKGNISLNGDSYGGAIVVWSEFPHDIYAQQISSNGNLGEVITSISHKTLENNLSNLNLLQNYPNPFNPDTEIRYQLPEARLVKLEIYNLLGQKIRTLIDGQKPAGSHIVRWDGMDDSGTAVSSGVYLYTLTAARFCETRKMVLMR